jgi:hypothetical protein
MTGVFVFQKEHWSKDKNEGWAIIEGAQPSFSYPEVIE